MSGAPHTIRSAAPSTASSVAPHAGSPLLGLASGLAAGVVGALVMTGFQALLARGGVTSGVKGTPSTEKAADALSQATQGSALSATARPVAGEAVHYVVGGLVGGLYGLAAEVVPQVTAGQGAAMGLTGATVVDETLVPVLGLGDPLWKAPLVSHPYSYASHLVFGTATEGARKLLRRFFGSVQAGWQRLRAPGPLRLVPVPKSTAAAVPAQQQESQAQSWRTLGLAFLLGATAGPRTTAPLAAVSWAARLGWVDLNGSRLSWLASPKAATVLTPLAVGELVADKLPQTPHRTEAGGVVARAASGAVSGAALAGGRSWQAAAAGAAGAVAATYLGHAIRTRVARAMRKDWPIATVEDLLALTAAALVCVAALAPPADGAPARDER